MKKKLSLYFISFLLLLPPSVFALAQIPTLNRPVPYEGQWGDFELWGQFDFSGKNLDFSGITDKANTSYIDKHSNYLGGLNLGIYKGLQLRYQYLFSEQFAVRPVDPTEINTQYDGHDIRLHYSWDFSPSWLLNVQTGFRNHKIKPFGFQKYQVGNSSIESLDGTDVISIGSTDTAYLIGTSLTKSFNENIQITLGLEGRFIEVNANFTSPALDDRLIARLLKNEIPQQTPWQEQHLLITTAFEWHIWKPISVAMDFKHYQIWRKNYQPQAGKQDYNNNQQFDFYLFANVYKGLTFYGHAQIMTHYLLGEIPLTYNTRTNHRFNQPYGFLSGGLVYRF